MGCGLHFDGLEPEIAADAMLDMGHEIARGERGGFGEEVLRAPRAAARANHAVAEDVLFGEHGKIGGFETVLDAEHGQADGLLVHCAGFAPVGDAPDRSDAVIGKHTAHAFGRAFAPAADDDALPASLQLRDMGRRGLEDVDSAGGLRFAAFLRPLRREVAPRPAASIGRVGRIRRCKR